MSEKRLSAQHAFLHDLVDYAGLFPPARLPLGEAFPAFTRHQQQPEAWMLARFVLPAAQVADLATFAAHRPATPHRIALLGTGGATGAAFLRSVADDLEAMRVFELAHAGFAHLDAFEVRLPASAQTEGDVADLLAHMAHTFGQAGYPNTALFLELPFSAEGMRLRQGALAVMRAFNEAAAQPRVGLKLRTGGVTADLFPSPEALAHALVDVHAAGVPFKATAGLHHPVRHYADAVATHMHGFLNVFGGAVLLYTHDLDAEALTALLEDQDASAFALTDDAFTYRDLRATAEQIDEARRAFAISYGSCSFDEPVEDLQALGWL